jgi:hypothetical protein
MHPLEAKIHGPIASKFFAEWKTDENRVNPQGICDALRRYLGESEDDHLIVSGSVTGFLSVDHSGTALLSFVIINPG